LAKDSPAKKPGRRLKVFAASLGFYDSVVAAASQGAALEAWGVRQNLFAEGQARVESDPKAVAAALAHPGQPLHRPMGSDEPYALEPGALPKVPAGPKKTPAPAKTAPTDRPPPKAAKPPPPPADRGDLDAAEAALRGLDHDRTAEEAAFARRREALDTEEVKAQADYVAARRDRKQAVEKARAAYAKAGGRD
jgi:hypothetical protein